MTALLARQAEHVYWAARYLERAEGTARIVREYTTLVVDLPTSAMSGWQALRANLESPRDRRTDEPVWPATSEEDQVIELLLADEGNPSSVLRSIGLARENLRQCRDVVPVEAWVTVNELSLYAAANCRDSLARAGRIRFLDQVVAQHQRLIGIFVATMVRDTAFTFMRLGRHLERADMTTCLLCAQVNERARDRSETQRAYDDHRWMGILRALSAVQAFRHHTRGPITTEAVLACALHDADFPRSVAYCLRAAAEDIQRLPRSAPATTAASRALSALDDVDVHDDLNTLEKALEALQRAIEDVHDALDGLYLASAMAPN